MSFFSTAQERRDGMTPPRFDGPDPEQVCPECGEAHDLPAAAPGYLCERCEAKALDRYRPQSCEFCSAAGGGCIVCGLPELGGEG